MRTIQTLLATFLALSFAHIPALAAGDAWRVAATPPVLSMPVRFNHAGAELSGTLYYPRTSKPVPAVVAFHGADIADADAALYRHLREGLPAIGIAVLVFDRRGTGRSTGTLNDIDYETLADDGIAGARRLATFAFIDSKRIGYWGLSQGGWLAVLASERDPASAFAVSVSAPLVTPERQMEFAMSNRLSVNGYSQSSIDAMLAARKAWTGYLRGDVPRAAAVAALRKIERQPWFDLMYMPTSKELTTDPATSSWRKEMDDDPMTAVRASTKPVLFIYGSADPWIPVAETLPHLKVLSQTHPGITYAVVAGANHDMMFLSNETMQSDRNALMGAAPQVPAYFMLLASWLTLHALERG